LLFENKENKLQLCIYLIWSKQMAKAKTFSSTELRRVLDYIATRKHAARNRAMLLLTHWGGMRVGEVAALRYCDVLNSDGTPEFDS
jgi:integrase